MINTFLQLVIKETLSLLAAEKNFFDLSPEERKEKAQQRLAPFSRIIDYLSTVTEKDFLQDLTGIISYLTQGKKTEKTALVEAFAQTCMFDLSKMVDGVAFSTKTPFLEKILALFHIYSFQEISTEAARFLEKTVGCAYVVVQAPTLLSADMRQEIRRKLYEQHSYCFPSFTLEKNLIGGMRILVNGQTTDLSWYGKVMRLSQLLYQRN